jgi:hypothetical protein
MMNLQGLRRHGRLNVVLTVMLAMLWGVPAAAFQFNFGEVDGSFDTTLSYGVSWRVSDRDEDIIGIANGGRAYSVNGDDGNLNYDDGNVISQVGKITSDLELRYKDYGLFVRGSAFYDIENERRDRERTQLTNAALDLVGSDADILDAYVWWNFAAGNVLGQVRAGDQVLSWGESTFIQNGINIINPFDVSKLRVPGAELKEGLVPVGMVSGSISPTENLTFEGFYQYDWEQVEIDPLGSYWSTTDIVGTSANKVMLGFGGIPDSIPPGSGLPINVPVGVAVPRSATQYADNDGQFGLALRWYVPALNETELGFYFINYHSRLPIISAKTGSLAGVVGGDYAASARYFTEYPEDIKLYGVSFNTQFDSTGIALQGEYSYREDVPLQVDDVEILFAALSPINPALGLYGQLGSYGFEEEIQGYREMDVSQAQMTATKLFGPTFGANQFVVVGEVGWTHVHDMPSKDKLRFEAPGTYISGNQALAGAHAPTAVGLYEDESHFADADSWGYRLATRLDYNNAIGAITLSPRIAWAHDVKGNTPGPGGNFLEDRRAITYGLGASYQSTWSADLSYTDYFGAGRYNLVNDRDFVAFNIKYSF